MLVQLNSPGTSGLSFECVLIRVRSPKHWDSWVPGSLGHDEQQDGVNGLWTEKEMTVEAVIEEEIR